MINKDNFSKNNKQNKFLYLFFCFIIFILIFSTGFFSDDFSEFSNIKDTEYVFSYLPSKIFINIPVLYYTHYIFYYLISIENFILISLIKFVYTLLSFYMVTKFFSIHTNYHNSLLIVFFFIFWPTHDSTVYFFLAQYLMLTIAFQFYAYYLLKKNFFKLSIIFNFLGSFISYGSTPISVGLCFLFLINKSYKKGIIFIIPNIIYIFYYVLITKVFFTSSISRIPESFNILNIIKNYTIQFLTLLDTNIGISFFLKSFYSILENNLFTLIFSILVSIIYFFLKKKCSRKFDKFLIDFKLLLAFTLIILVAIFMFAVTGSYYQVAFNLGNRVSIYSALLFSYLFICMINKTESKKINFFVMLLGMMIIFGISNHWKKATYDQNVIIENISSNQKLKDYDNKNILFVVGNEYSKFGKFSHIEFFSASHVAESIFNIKNLEHIKVKTLNSSFILDSEYLKDLKFSHRKFLVDEKIMIYDSISDKLKIVKKDNLNYYINTLHKNTRHWIQLQNIKFINEFISKYFFNISYLF